MHDTELSWLPCVALGLGVDWMVHAEPSHDSASVITWSFSTFWPTASQELTVVHETELKAAVFGPGVAWLAHEVPFHTAAFWPEAPSPTASQKSADRQEIEVTFESPATAGPADHDVPSQISTFAKPSADRQKLVLVHDTSCVSTSSAPGRSWAVHDVPFHIAAAAPAPPAPTASQNCGDRQETFTSELPRPPDWFVGLGVD